MFSIDIKRASLTFLIAAYTCLVAGEYDNSNPFTATGLGGKNTLVAGSDYVPDSGDNGKPTIRITVGAPRGSQLSANLTILIPADYVIYSSNPLLTWETDQPITTGVKLTVTNEYSTEPVIHKIFVKTVPAGMHTIDLSKYSGIMAGQEYQWAMSICRTKKCTKTSTGVARTSFHYMN